MNESYQFIPFVVIIFVIIMAYTFFAESQQTTSTMRTNCVQDGGEWTFMNNNDVGCYKNGNWIPVRR